MNIHQNEKPKYLFAIRDKDDGAIHSSRYYCIDDAMSAIDEVAYEFEIDSQQLEVVELIRR
jgi:hypothetical protein